jgi:hypothetical protein
MKLLIRNKVGIGQTRQQSLTAAGKQWEVVVGKNFIKIEQELTLE